MQFNDKIIPMTKIKLGDFGKLYRALSEKKTTIPVKVLRSFKNELYNYILTNTPTAKIQVANIDDERIQDKELAMYIGTISDFGKKGLTGITSEEWYKNIILGDLQYSAEDLLRETYPVLIKQNTTLPLHRYLSQSSEKFVEIEKKAKEDIFENIINSSIKKGRKTKEFKVRSVNAIWQESLPLHQKCLFLTYLKEDEIDVSSLERILTEIFKENPEILSSNALNNSNIRTNIRRLIRIYDYLKFFKAKEPQNG